MWYPLSCTWLRNASISNNKNYYYVLNFGLVYHIKTGLLRGLWQSQVFLGPNLRMSTCCNSKWSMSCEEFWFYLSIENYEVGDFSRKSSVLALFMTKVQGKIARSWDCGRYLRYKLSQKALFLSYGDLKNIHIMKGNLRKFTSSFMSTVQCSEMILEL